MDFWSQKQSCRLPVTTSRTPRETPKEPKWNKTYSDKHGQSSYHQKRNEKNTVKETEKPQLLEPILDKGETSETTINNETTNNSCENNPKDTSIKEMQSTDPFCKRIVKRLLNKTAPAHELKTFFIHNGLYRYASDHSKDFCTLVIPKAWRYTILVETHDKMGHQGNNRTYSPIKRQYYWKGMAKDVKDYIQQCPVG